jgi:hypothetical protein
MKKIQSIALVSVMTLSTMGIVGCGGSSSGGSEPVEESAYNKPVNVDEETARTALNVAFGGIGLLPDSASATSKGDDSALSDSKNVGVQMMERLRSLKVAESVKAQYMPEEQEISLTGLPCSVSGTYDLYTKHEYNSMPIPPEGGADQTISTYKLTFHDCKTGLYDPILEGAFANLLENPYNGETYILYNGSLETIRTETYGDINYEAIHRVEGVVNANNLTATIGDDVENMLISANANLTFSESSIGYMYPLSELSFDINGTLSLMDDYGSLAFEAQEFGLSLNYQSDPGGHDEKITLNGYAGLTMTQNEPMVMAAPAEDGPMSETLYLYAENLVIDQSSREENITTTTVDGVLGLPCFGEDGGTVEYDTLTDIKLDSQLYDVDGYQGETPFVGTTTISGANASVATVNFDKNDSNITSGTITIGDVTTEPDSLPDMIEEYPCEIGIYI